MRKVSKQRLKIRTATIEALEERKLLSTIYSADMSANPGWTLDTGWQYGVPAGTGGDPSSGHTGTKVVGTVITSPGTYPNNVPSTYWATTGAINCAAYTGVTLSFWRYLGVLSGDTATISVSSNGTSWTNIWSHSNLTVTDSSWSLQTFDISAYADRQSTVYIRWGLGPTNATGVSFGWNIDDVTVSGNLDTTAPAILNESPSDGDVFLTSSFNVDVWFSEPVRNVAATDLVLNGRAAAGAIVGTPVNVAGNEWRFPVSGASNGGLTLTLGAHPGDITDTAGNSLPPNTWGCSVNLMRKIAYVSDDALGDPTVWTMDADGSGQINILDGLRFSGSPSYSHDGQKILYNYASAIWEANADGTGAVQLTTPAASTSDYDAVFSPDDARIAYCHSPSAGSHEIWVMNTDGTGQTRLSNSDDTSPFFSPDGTKLVFSSRRNGQYPDIYVMNVNGTNPIRLTTSPVGSLGNYDPEYSPDGTRIVYSCGLNWTYEIYVMNADGAGQTRLTNNTASDQSPRFSLEGDRIVFSSDRDGYTAIYVMGTDGSAQTRISATGVGCYWPSWGIDLYPPAVASINRVGASATNATSVQFAVNFREYVWGVDLSDFVLSTTGTASGTIASVTGSGASYTVTVNTSGDGMLGLNLVDDDSVEDRVGNRLGGWGAGNGNFTGQTYTVDHSIPAVVSIIRASPSPTEATTLSYTVTFSESVSGVDAADFSLVTTGGVSAAISSVSLTGNVATVQISPISGEGTLGLNLVDNDSIADVGGNQLGGTGAGNGNFTGQVYTVDHAPKVVSIMTNGSWYNNTAQASWTITFSKNVTGFTSADLQVVTTGTATGGVPVITGSGSTYTATVSSVAGDGTMILNLKDYDRIVDSVGNPLGGVGSGNGDFNGTGFTIDHTAPTVFADVNSSGAASQRSMVTRLIVIFSEAMSLTPGSFALCNRAGTSVPNVYLSIKDSYGDQRTYDVTFTGSGAINGSVPDGAYRLVVVAAATRDLAGNPIVADYRLRFFRLFGDSNGDRQVDRTNLVSFRQALNVPANYVSYFDYNGDGKIDFTDYAQFRKRLLRWPI